MFLARPVLLRGLLAILALCGVMAGEAKARVFVGFGIGVPLFLPPPVYYPPYYRPPMGYAPPEESEFSYVPPSAQPQNLAPPRGYYPPSRDYTPSQGYGDQQYGGYSPSDGPGGAQSCQAGAYVCPLVAETPPGGACTCPGHGGQRIRGRAD
jgi:hypothetical protein